MLWDLTKKLFAWVYDLIEVFVISASIFVVVYLFLMQPHQVKGSSMYPTFKNKEYLLTDKITYRRRLPKYGDIIVFKAPINENLDFIKRVMAVGGDVISVNKGRVYINGQLLDESRYLPVGVKTPGGEFLVEGASYTVPEGTVFAMGDNREHSSDSRDWGPVPLSNIVGRAFFRYWPQDRIGIISNPVVAKNK
jgi:signal peptidase I